MTQTSPTPKAGVVMFAVEAVLTAAACLCVLFAQLPPNSPTGPAEGLVLLANGTVSLLWLAAAAGSYFFATVWLFVENGRSKRPECQAFYGPWPRRALWIWLLPLLLPAWFVAAYFFTEPGAAIFFILLAYLRLRRR